MNNVDNVFVIYGCIVVWLIVVIVLGEILYV